MVSGAQLEEKRIPYTVEKINMRCYGDKPPEYTRKVRRAAVHERCRTSTRYLRMSDGGYTRVDGCPV